MATKEITVGNLVFLMQDANTLGVEITKEGFRKAQPEHETWDATSLVMSAWSTLVLCVAYTVAIAQTDGELTADESALLDFWQHTATRRRDYVGMWELAQNALMPEHLNIWFKAYMDTRPNAITAPDTLQTSQKEAEGKGGDFLAPTVAIEATT